MNSTKEPTQDSEAGQRRRRFLLGAAGSAGLLAGAGLARGAEAQASSHSVSSGEPEFKKVTVRDAAWAYRDKGAGPVALFLHPFLMNSALWLDQLNALGDIRRCIAPDMRGWGRSEAVTDTRLDLYEYARDVVSFLEAARVEGPVDIVAMSVSSFIAGLVYEMAPDRVRSLTLISSAFDFERNLPYERYQKEMARVAVVEGKDAVFRRFDEYIDGPNSTLHMRARYKQMLSESRTEMIVAHLTNSGSTPARPDLPGKITVPVMIPAGSEDSIFSMDRFNDIATAYPNATVVPIEGAGRLIPLESPEVFNRALREFWT